MSDWYDEQRNPSGDLRQLLQERIEKANPSRKLTAEESKGFAKLETIVNRSKRGENAQNYDSLCRRECYMRTLRFKRVKPRAVKLAICASKS